VNVRLWPIADTLDLAVAKDKMTMTDHEHVVRIDEETREIVVFRLSDGGRRTLLTRASLPPTSGWTMELESLAAQLGENLLLDSPVARRLLDL